MKKIKQALKGLVAAPFAVVVSTVVVGAQNINDAMDQTGQAEGWATTAEPQSVIVSVVNWALWFVGILAVIMLIWGGIRYATSAGDSNKVTAAKNTILYAIIGLVVALFAYAIVNFLVTNV